MTFHDFFHDLSKFSLTISLHVAATLEISKNCPCFRVFFDLTQYNGQTAVSNKMCAICTVQLLLSYLSLPCHLQLTNLSTKTLISHYFPGPTIKFHDFPWKVKFLNFITFQVSHDLYEP